MSTTSTPKKPAEDYNAVHSRRFMISLEWLAEIMPERARVLELGGTSPFTAILKARCPDCAIHHIDGDIRYGFRSSYDFDVILCMEVLEHIADKEPDGIQAEWSGSGTSEVLVSVLEHLKRGGFFFLTTPNAASITAIHHALWHKPPSIFRPHVREYVPYELDDLLRAHEFEIVRRETLDVWRNAIAPEQHALISKFISDYGYPPELRGEDIFCLCKRPNDK